jgi:cytochrome P450
VLPLGDSTRRDPYPLYARLRADEPLSATLLPGTLAVSRHDDVVDLLSRPQAFSSRIMRPADPVLLGADGEEHRHSRAWVGRAIAALPMRELRDVAEQVATRLVRALRRRAEADLVEDLAEPLPIELTAAMLDLPTERLHDLRRWSAAVVALGTGTAAPGEAGALAEAQDEFAAFLLNETRRRRRRPGGDILSALLRDAPPRTNSEEQAVSISRLLVIASHETTSGLIATAAQALLRRPAMLARAKAEPRLLSPLVEETLRHDAPVQFVYRVAAHDTSVAGSPVPSGAVVVAMLGSANRDGVRFQRPDEFDPDRRPPHHIAFGAGTHACLGAQIARIEARAALAALVHAGPWRLAEDAAEVRWRATLQLRAPARLLVEVNGAGR